MNNIIKNITAKINESLKTKIDYNFEEYFGKSYEGVFVRNEIDNENIEITFDKYDIIDKFYEISFTRNNSLKLINKNFNSFKILGIVKNIIFDFIKEYNPNGFYYSVDDNSKTRISLYTKLAKEIQKNYIFKDDVKLGKGNYTFLFAKNEDIMKDILLEIEKHI